MARIKRNIVLDGSSGSIQKKILLKRYGKTTIITAYPDRSRVKYTAKQKQENSRFREAMNYARAQMADPVFKAEYQAKVKGMQRAHNLAIADFYKAPVIHHVLLDQWHGNTGDIIEIDATDNFKVVRVNVELRDSMGNILETGNSCAKNIRWWIYRQQNTYPESAVSMIIVRAWDKPGNVTQKQILVTI